MAPTDAAEIVFDHVTKRYPGREEAAVDDLSLTIPAGDICILVGPSGAGKTTAMKMVNRLIDYDEGDIRIDGTSIRDQDVDGAAPRDRLRDPARRPVPAHEHRRQHRDRPAAPRLDARAAAASASAELLELVGLEAGVRASATPRSSRAASASASAWRARSPPTRR